VKKYNIGILALLQSRILI